MPVDPILLFAFGEMMKNLYPLGWSQVKIGDGEFKLTNHLNGESLTIAIAV